MNPPDPSEYVVQFRDVQENALAFAESRGLAYAGPVPGLPGYHRFTLKRGLYRNTIEDPDQKVEWMERQVPRQQYTRDSSSAAVPPNPTDPLFGRQWHLQMTRAKDAWDAGYTGKGVRVAIVDDGLQHTHPDLQKNYIASSSLDFNGGKGDPSPGPSDFHGTACAGVVGAEANNTHCGTGVCPGCGISGLRLIAAPTTDLTEATALGYMREHGLDIYSNSWGPQDTGMHLAGPGRIVLETFAASAVHGRGGKGSIYVWASGNGAHVGDSCSYDGYASSPYTIAVGAIDDSGKRSYYSEGCPALMCVAPSSGRKTGITTTDIDTPGLGYDPGSECTTQFGGTSSACPLAAGVIALALQANPSLTWRDVQVLVAKTSKVVDITEASWSNNRRGFRHSEQYGFGLIDAKDIVIEAKRFEHLPAQKGFSSGRVALNLPIPNDGTPVCISHRFSGSHITFVEHVLFRVNIRHPRRGQLKIRLQSPEEVVSTFANVHPDPNPNYAGWLFTSVRHFGESSADGEWRVCVEDGVPRDAYGNGMFDSFELAVFGH